MRTFAFLLVLTLAAGVAAAPVPPPTAREAQQLVEKLGSQDYAEREAATKRLDELGALALDALRGAGRSDDPEVAERAKDLLRKIERRLGSERALTPTTVELEAKDQPLDDVLAALSKQSGYEVVLGGTKADELAAKKVTIPAAGKVPFWAAILKVCDAADLQLAVVSGFVAPGSAPYFARANQIRGILEGMEPKARVATELERAVVLEARGTAKKRPGSVHNAVLVEAFEVPRPAVQVSAAVLQFWPEPRVAGRWHSVTGLKITKATGADGRALTPDVTPPPAPPLQPQFRPGKLVVPEPDGGLAVGPGFKPNIRQTVAKFKPGEERVTAARELTGSAFGQVRSAVDPMAALSLDPDKVVAVTGAAGVELSARTRTANGKTFANVTLSFPPAAVEPARTGEELSGVKPPATGGNRTVLGVRVTDPAGAAFDLALADQTSDFDITGRRIVVKMTLELVAAKDGPTVPAKVTFWGTSVRPVEIPFALKDVPLR